MGKVKNQFIIIIVLLISSFIVLYFVHLRKIAEIESKLNNLPDEIGEWKKVTDIKYKDKIFEILGTKDVIGRTYKNNNGQVIEITIVHAINNRSAFHPPEYCIKGSGAELLSKKVEKFQISVNPVNYFDVNEMVFLSKDNKNLFVWNWYVEDKFMTANFYRQQLNSVYDIIKNGYTNGAMIRLISYINNNNQTIIRRSNIDFVKALIPILKSIL